MPNLLKVDFHCHTEYSKDSLTRIRDLERAARAAGLDRVVITDHNRLDGAMQACEIAPDLFIPGEEILTDRGELLAAFVSRAVPKGLPWREAIQQLNEQGAFISVSHPFDVQRHGWHHSDLSELTKFVDAIEGFNARCYSNHLNTQAQAFALGNSLACTAGSDAHTANEVGQGRLILPEFSTAEELRSVISQAQIAGSLSPFSVHFHSTYARWVKKLGFRRVSP